MSITNQIEKLNNTIDRYTNEILELKKEYKQENNSNERKLQITSSIQEYEDKIERANNQIFSLWNAQISAATIPPAQVQAPQVSKRSVRDKFTDILNQCDITPSSTDVHVDIALEHYRSLVLDAIQHSDAELALSAYNKAKSHLFRSTKASIQSIYNVKLNGAISFNNARALFVSGISFNHKNPKIMKIPYFGYDLKPELDAIISLKLNDLPKDIRLVKCDQILVKKLQKDPLCQHVGVGDKQAILMDYFVCDLSKVPFHQDPLLFCDNLFHLIKSILYIHDLGYVHMDIKIDNIFVDSNGDWRVGDFGSLVEVGKSIRTYTPECYPAELDVRSNRPSSFHYDWIALGVTMATHMSNGDYNHFFSEERYCIIANIKKFFEDPLLLISEPLRTLLLALIDVNVIPTDTSISYLSSQIILLP